MSSSLCLGYLVRKSLITTTLDLGLQKSIEGIFASHKNRLRRIGVTQSGCLIASTRGEVLAMVGSLGYREKDQGFNNAVLAFRSAGSTLKPFLYAMALEKGSNAASEIPDTFRSYRTPQGDYLPLNADRRFYGPVSIRSALGNSLNISAVKMARKIGTEPFYHLLEGLELASNKLRSANDFGLGLAIGNLEVNLFRLVQAYGALAQEGEYPAFNSTLRIRPLPREGNFLKKQLIWSAIYWPIHPHDCSLSEIPHILISDFRSRSRLVPVPDSEIAGQ